ncbi:AMSH-like ubiquitin thioesterase 1 [Linum perenne]
MMPAPSSSDRINVAASARRLDVDNRISLRFYYRIADNVLRQAYIFRQEKNIIDLYIMLLRFSSLVSETIPCHREFKSSSQAKKLSLKKQLLGALQELEKLKPAVQQKINELNHNHTYQVNGQSYNVQSNVSQWPSVPTKPIPSYDFAQASSLQRPSNLQISLAKPVAEQFGRMSLSFPRPKDETLSKHSIFGPNGLYGNWQPPSTDKRVQYPSNIDLSPVEIPSLQESVTNALPVKKDSGDSRLGSFQQSIGNGFPQKSDSRISEPQSSSRTESTLNLYEKEANQSCQTGEPNPMISFDTEDIPVLPDIIRQPSPPAVLAEVQDLAPLTSPQVTEPEHKMDISAPDVRKDPLQLHISTTMMESFMKLAKRNTDNDLETCGILAGSLKNRKFYITALIIPKQESTSSSCQATNEEEIFEVQDKRSLFPLGWIHTHPTQSCFMSSIDVHTHYSYQIMLPESVAIVMAPRDSSRQVSPPHPSSRRYLPFFATHPGFFFFPTCRKHGIFRLTTPGGMSVIRQCQQRGFHPHDPPPDGGPIYDTCTDVYMNPTLKFEVIDLR